MFSTSAPGSITSVSYRVQTGANEEWAHPSGQIACSPWEGLYLDQASSSSAAK